MYIDTPRCTLLRRLRNASFRLRNVSSAYHAERGASVCTHPSLCKIQTAYIWRILQGEASAHAQSSLQMALTERRNQDMLFRALPHEIGVHTTRSPPRGIHRVYGVSYRGECACKGV